MQSTEWRDIPGLGGFYEVSNIGEARSKRSGRLLSQSEAPGGYKQIKGSVNGVPFTRRTNRMVALAFIGPPTGEVVRHLDGNPRNNNVENLAYGTQSENIFDAVRHGTHPWSSRTHCKYGHEYTPENTRYTKNERARVCITCARRTGREWKRKENAKKRGISNG